jgi:ketosteroid isomerase-like protein
VVSRENVDLVCSIYLEWERGEYGLTAWADPDIEWVIADGPAPGSWTGRDNMARIWREWLDVWADFRVEAEEYRELDDERVLALVRFRGRTKTSGVDIADVYATGAAILHIRQGKVTKFVINWERDRALADLDLEE